MNNLSKDNNEVWIDIPDYEGLYQVSNLGRVKSLARKYKTGLGVLRSIDEKIMNLFINKHGYYFINLYKDSKQSSRLVHRLVW